MPRGSNYGGPREALEMYESAVEASGREIPLKGAKNPYTSRNGHMFSFLTKGGQLAVRLSDDMREEFAAKYETGDVIQYGSVMRGYVSVPPELLADTAAAGEWLGRSYDWIGTLPAKPTK